MIKAIKAFMDRKSHEYQEWKEDFTFEMQKKYVEGFEDGLKIPEDKRKAFLIKSLFQAVFLFAVCFLTIYVIISAKYFLMY